MSRVIVIDVNRQEVRHADADGLRDLQTFVGGYIATGSRLPGGHVLFVDDEGLFKPQRWFFRLGNIERPFAGSGVICGPEDREGNTLDCLLPISAVRRAVAFIPRAEIDAWVEATAEEPEITLASDTGPPEVIATRGDVWGGMPHAEEDVQ